MYTYKKPHIADNWMLKDRMTNPRIILNLSVLNFFSSSLIYIIVDYSKFNV